MEKFFFYVPHFFQNLLISAFNYLQYKKRYGGNYKKYKIQFHTNKNLSLKQLQHIQKQRYEQFLNNTVQYSTFYKNIKHIENFNQLEQISKLPILDKETLRVETKSIVTINAKEGIISKTGGTTGKSLTVYFTKDNMQERFAMLDAFRETYGYVLGKKTAWFSGKALLSHKDLLKKRFWKTDYLHKVRYYSTFHIKTDYLKYYVENLLKFCPEYIVGFPSSIYEVASYGLQHNLNFKSGVVKAIFPTAEVVTNTQREVIETFFNSKMIDQYASSEGAPFIFECKMGNLHLELQSGVFEVLDQHNLPTQSGRLIVTSFTTYGTPLIRYDIGDTITLKNGACTCGNQNPMVQTIGGRIDDFVYSKENGKINLGNISNTLKGTKGILKFQVVQNDLDTLEIYLQVDQLFNPKQQSVFLKNWEDRVGRNMKINLQIVNEIKGEQSGKFRLVKNNIKHLISN